MIYYIQNGNGPGRDTPACDSPNPPFWCDEYNPDPEPGAPIDAGIPIMIGLAVILILTSKFWKK